VNPRLRVAAFRRSSRESVDAARANRRAISRAPISLRAHYGYFPRSANDNYRPDRGDDAAAR